MLNFLVTGYFGSKTLKELIPAIEPVLRHHTVSMETAGACRNPVYFCGGYMAVGIRGIKTISESGICVPGGGKSADLPESAL